MIDWCSRPRGGDPGQEASLEKQRAPDALEPRKPRRVHWGSIGSLVLLGAVGIGAWLVTGHGDGTAGSGREDPRGQAEVTMPSSRGDTTVVTWTRVIEIASGEAYQGPWRMNESDFRYVDAPTVAIDEKGALGVAWVDQSRKDIFFQIYGPDGKARLEEPANVSRSPEIFSWLPRMAMAPGDPRQVYILWQEIVFSGGSHGGEIFFARSADGGRTFGDPVNLSNSPAGDGKGRLTTHDWHNGSLDLAMDPQGDLYVTWTEYEGALWFRRSTDGGRSFSDPLRLVGGDEPRPATAWGTAGDPARGPAPVVGHGPARGPALAVDAQKTVYVAWTVGEDPAADIRLAKSDDGGRSFSEPRVVHESGGHADAPKIAVDGEGTVHLVYAESPAGPLDRYRIRYARSTDDGRTFENPSEISDPHAEAYESVNFPGIGLDREDNLYLLWHLFPDRGFRPRGLGFSFSRDGGRTRSRRLPWFPAPRIRSSASPGVSRAC